jgi:cytochrome b561
VPLHYSRLQIVLHWVVFFLIAFQFVAHDPIEDAWEAMRDGTGAAPGLMAWAHVAAGLGVLILVLIRLVVRLTRGVPPVPAEEPPILKMVAHVTHWAFYVLMIVLPIGGMMAWFGGVAFAAEVHGTVAPVLMVLIILHIVGAFYHQFILKTNLLQRMRKPG